MVSRGPTTPSTESYLDAAIVSAAFTRAEEMRVVRRKNVSREEFDYALLASQLAIENLLEHVIESLDRNLEASERLIEQLTIVTGVSLSRGETVSG